MTINQIIAFCLVAVLVAFVVVLAIMAVHAIELLKKTKVLVDSPHKSYGGGGARKWRYVDGCQE